MVPLAAPVLRIIKVLVVICHQAHGQACLHQRLKLDSACQSNHTQLVMIHMLVRPMISMPCAMHCCLVWCDVRRHPHLLKKWKLPLTHSRSQEFPRGSAHLIVLCGNTCTNACVDMHLRNHTTHACRCGPPCDPQACDLRWSANVRLKLAISEHQLEIWVNMLKA